MNLSTQYKVRIAYAPLLMMPLLWYWNVQALEDANRKARESKPKKITHEIMPALTPVVRINENGDCFWNQISVKDSSLKDNIDSYLARTPKQTIILKAMPKATIQKVWDITAYINQNGGKVTVVTLPDTSTRKKY